MINKIHALKPKNNSLHEGKVRVSKRSHTEAYIILYLVIIFIKNTMLTITIK